MFSKSQRLTALTLNIIEVNRHMAGICYLNIIRLHLLDYDPPVTEKCSHASESQSFICRHKINAPLHSFKQVILKQFKGRSFFDQGSFFLWTMTSC